MNTDLNIIYFLTGQRYSDFYLDRQLLHIILSNNNQLLMILLWHFTFVNAS